MQTSGDPQSSEDSVVKRLDSSEYETELIDRLLGGDAQAWEVFVDRYGGVVRSRVSDVASLFGRRNDWSTIDDVTAEVFATLLSRDGAALRCFQRQSRFSTYLSVIATRVARRVIASLVRRSHGQTESLEEVQAAPSEQDVSRHLIDREEIERLLLMVQRLPPRQRELVVAFYREEQTYAEISHRFDIPIGSIGTTLRRAEKTLRQWIDDDH